MVTVTSVSASLEVTGGWNFGRRKVGGGISQGPHEDIFWWMWGIRWEGETQPERLYTRGQDRPPLTLYWVKLRGRARESVHWLFCKFSLVIWRLWHIHHHLPSHWWPLPFSIEWFIARVKILGNCLRTKNMLRGSKPSITLPHETHVFSPNLRLFFLVICLVVY